VPVISTAPEEAAEHFGWIGAFFAVDAPASSALTQEQGHDFHEAHPGCRLIEAIESQ
jgi:hypothetical protein